MTDLTPASKLFQAQSGGVAGGRALYERRHRPAKDDKPRQTAAQMAAELMARYEATHPRTQ